jgi:regulator of replication initiation timing
MPDPPPLEDEDPSATRETSKQQPGTSQSKPATAGVHVASGGGQETTNTSTNAYEFNDHDTTTAESRDPFDSSSLSVAPMDPSRGPEDTMTEEAVHEHLQDVESSFLPRLSPIPTGANNALGGVDDTYIFDSPNKADMQAQHPSHRAAAHADDSSYTPTTGDSTSNLEHLDSSPTAAAAARTISRAVSMAGRAAPRYNTDSADNAQQQYKSEETADDEGGREGQDSSQVSSIGDQDASRSRSQSLSERFDAGSTPGQALRNPKRPKYLRSRFGSTRSSTSSFATNPESQDGSDITTLGYGADYALQSGGAVPALGASSRSASNILRQVSMGSVASGFDEYTDPSLGQLETLPEVASPDRSYKEDMAKTPKPSKENLNTTPTDTVIARHVRNVQVPESLAKEYRYKSGLETPRRPSNFTAMGASTNTTTNTGRGGKSLTLKEQSSTIERLSKENFDLKLKVMFLSDRLDKLSEEGIKEMISENVDLKTSLAVLQRDNKVLRRRIKELEKQKKDDDARPSTARSGTSSTDQTARMYDEDAQEKEEELIFLRERVEEYATEIERLRTESNSTEAERRKMADVVRTLRDRSGESLGRQEEADVWKDLVLAPPPLAVGALSRRSCRGLSLQLLESQFLLPFRFP